MANGLLKKLALAGMVGASALFGAKEAKGMPAWNSFSQIAGENNFTGQSVNYTSGSINFTDQNGNLIQNNPSFSLVYFASLPAYGGITMAVGGLDGSGRSASGWFLGADENYGVGLENGGTANQTEGSMDNGYWRMFVDVNGNGSYGSYENGVFIPEAGEEIASPQVSNFQGFQTGVGTRSAGDISGWYNVPEPSTSALTALGLSALALRRKRNPTSRTK